MTDKTTETSAHVQLDEAILNAMNAGLVPDGEEEATASYRGAAGAARWRGEMEEVLDFAKAYVSLGTAIQEQIDQYLYVGPVGGHPGPVITPGAMYLVRERLINPFRDCQNEDLAHLVRMLDEADREID